MLGFTPNLYDLVKHDNARSFCLGWNYLLLVVALLVLLLMLLLLSLLCESDFFFILKCKNCNLFWIVRHIVTFLFVLPFKFVMSR